MFAYIFGVYACLHVCVYEYQGVCVCVPILSSVCVCIASFCSHPFLFQMQKKMCMSHSLVV